MDRPKPLHTDTDISSLTDVAKLEGLPTGRVGYTKQIFPASERTRLRVYGGVSPRCKLRDVVDFGVGGTF